MATFKAFKAIRPREDLADKVAALPYDVMNSEEAREMVRGNPYSFLHIDKAEIDLPAETDLYSEEVYQKAKSNLEKMISEGIFIEDKQAHFYIYTQIMEGRSQTGLVGCAGVDDYIENRIKKHELTRADKEADRTRHVDTLDANTGPIFLIHESNENIALAISEYKLANKPVYDFVTDQGVRNTVWKIESKELTKLIEAEFEKMSCLYIADGHHRSASAISVAKKRRAEKPGYSGDEEFNRFLAISFPADELAIMDYNRLIKDLKGKSFDEFLNDISQDFDVKSVTAEGPFAPKEAHSFGMYHAKEWFELKAKPGSFDEKDPVESLDVSILQKNLIGPLLGIEDPRTDERIDFVGGIRGLKELERRVEDGMALAFSMYPTTVRELIDIADAGKIMPPKSTWFEPKLLSGLFIHKLS